MGLDLIRMGLKKRIRMGLRKRIEMNVSFRIEMVSRNQIMTRLRISIWNLVFSLGMRIE